MGIRLTQTVTKGGCAAKIAAGDLRVLLSGLRFPPRIPETLIDGSLFDDAAVTQITADVAAVHTLDFKGSRQVFGHNAMSEATRCRKWKPMRSDHPIFRLLLLTQDLYN